MENMPTTEVSHTHRDAAGRAWIDDRNVKVIEVLLDHLSTGSTPEEIHLQHPRISLAQIRAALAFYYDNREEFDAEINRGLEQADKVWAAARTPLFGPVCGHWANFDSVVLYLDGQEPRV
jgi:uncharacterized protein (DUF433 family)